MFTKSAQVMLTDPDTAEAATPYVPLTYVCQPWPATADTAPLYVLEPPPPGALKPPVMSDPAHWVQLIHTPAADCVAPPPPTKVLEQPLPLPSVPLTPLGAPPLPPTLPIQPLLQLHPPPPPAMTK